MKFHHQRMRYLAVVAPVLACGTAALAQTPDPAILNAIRGIHAIDNHSHPPALATAGKRDEEFDALPCDPLEPTSPALSSRPDNPRFLAAWKSLYGYRYDDADSAHLRELSAAKARVKTAQGDHYPAWVLDRLGIETELANRVAPGRGLDAPRFRWVPFVDALLFPLDNSALAAYTPDRKIFFAREDALLARYMSALGVNGRPATLDAYLSGVVTPTLERLEREGAVAVKYEAAYLRSLDFTRGDRSAAESVYAKHAAGGVPGASAYRTLQDVIFHHIAVESGRLGLPVHIHTGYGCGGYFELAGANPLLLEPVLDDASLRNTKFVLLHGGAGPYSKGIAALLMKPNVYTDFSEQTWLLPTRELAATLRYWLEWYPEKVLFGTDLSPGTATIDWEEIGWQTTTSAREALAIALTGMMNDREVTRAHAIEIARMVLRGNALTLYGWQNRMTP
ncbi:MAG TPA: amidohydrolase family protein [Gemmatimonadaceae bacterium]|nr:amidohydrolase family protein [Gemmatimonadaceae bacterium]